MHTQTQGVIIKMLNHCSPMSLPGSSSVDNLKSTSSGSGLPTAFLKDLRICLTWTLLLVQTYKLTWSIFQVVSRTINYFPKSSFQNNFHKHFCFPHCQRGRISSSLEGSLQSQLMTNTTPTSCPNSIERQKRCQRKAVFKYRLTACNTINLTDIYLQRQK